MLLGMSLAAFTQFHVILSLIGIASGLVVLIGMIAGRRLGWVTALFLLTSVLTDVTGFMFPSPFDAAEVVGLISLAFLAAAILAFYVRGLAGAWRGIYAVSATVAVYLNVFVLIAQIFQKVPFFHALAPKGNEPPFAALQGVALLVFVGLGVAVFRKFRPMSATTVPA